MKTFKNVDEISINRLCELIDESDIYSILIDREEKIDNIEKKMLEELAAEFVKDFYDKYTKNEDYNKIMLKKCELMSCYIDYVLKQDVFLLNKINLIERELAELQGDSRKTLRETLLKTKVIIEDVIKIYIDFDKVTVKEFFNYVEYIKEKSENMIKQKTTK